MIEVPRAAQEAGSGLLLIDKPAAATSHDVVAAVRRLAATRKVGHAGTLDPMATGLLVLGVGAGTKLLTYLSGLDKNYEATIRFGVGTDTDDAEGHVTASPGYAGDVGAIDAVLASLTGQLDQVPSTYSAKKIAGQKAYDLAREGKRVDLEPVPVRVDTFDRVGQPRHVTVGQIEVIDVDVNVSVSSGTYIRALARDAGAALGSAAHLTALRRTRVGPFRVVDGLTIDSCITAVESGPLPLMRLADGAGAVMGRVEISEAQERSLRYGQVIDVDTDSYPVALVRDLRLVAIGVPRHSKVGPSTVFPAGA